MNLARQLALLAALLALVLILGTTELTLVWSSRARLTELRNESIALAETWAEYLARAAPRGDTTALRVALSHWPDEHITATSASVFLPARWARARGHQRFEFPRGRGAQGHRGLLARHDAGLA